MADANVATVNIPKDVIDPIVRAEISSAITRALGNHDHLVREAVRTVLDYRVDVNGRRSEYERNNTYSFIEVRCRTILETVVTEMLQEAILARSEDIRKEIHAQLSRKKSALVKSLADSFCEAATKNARYSIKLNVSFED
jgi:hypothetical protein